MVQATPETTSSAYARWAPMRRQINDILSGPAAIRAAGVRYLPKHEGESREEYNRRLEQAPWQPEFEDILRTLVEKPFGSPTISEGPAEIVAYADDIDLRGSNLTTFARSIYRGGLAYGEHYILVEFPRASGVRTRADEIAANLRPYWVSIPADDVLAIYRGDVNGREVVLHARIRQNSVELEGFREVTVERIRVLEPGTWTVYRRITTKVGVSDWIVEDEGLTAPLREVPLVSFVPGERDGCPPLAAIADKQIELYRALARQDEILTKTAYPMLTANGMAPPGPGKSLKVGPGRILYAPPSQTGQTGWAYIQPDAAGIREVREGVRALVEDIRRLGMQPLVQRSGAITATASAIDGARAHTVAQAWALALQGALEQAWSLTMKWLGRNEAIKVSVDTDWAVEPYAQGPLQALNAARDRKDLSLKTYWRALRRFDVLPPDFDPEKEEDAIADEVEGLTDEVMIDPVTGLPAPPLRDPNGPAGAGGVDPTGSR